MIVTFSLHLLVSSMFGVMGLRKSGSGPLPRVPYLTHTGLEFTTEATIFIPTAVSIRRVLRLAKLVLQRSYWMLHSPKQTLIVRLLDLIPARYSVLRSSLVGLFLFFGEMFALHFTKKDLSFLVLKQSP